MNGTRPSRSTTLARCTGIANDRSYRRSRDARVEAAAQQNIANDKTRSVEQWCGVVCREYRIRSVL